MAGAPQLSDTNLGARRGTAAPIGELVAEWIDRPAKPNPHLAAALDLARRGFAVFPLKAKGKVPLLPEERGGRGCLDATRDERVITGWWGPVPRANIGIATGNPSGTFVLDVDPRHGGDEALADLERHHGALPETVMSFTGGGRHLLFRHVAGIRNSSGKLGPGLDIRGDGGYVVAPPSVHESGRLYSWSVDHHPDDMPIAEAPAWLIGLARTPAPSKGTAEMPENWRRLVAEGVGQGKRNEAIARLTGHLLRKQVDPLVALDLVRVWNAARCRPPLDDGEVVRTVDSICQREMARREAPHAR